jgi:hypothetical protein
MQTVVETTVFTRQAEAILSADEKDELIAYLAANAGDGDLIPGASGVRKLRWTAKGKGTRGGARVIYYVLDADHPLFALMIYAKNEAADLSAAGRKAVAAIAAAIKAEARRK